MHLNSRLITILLTIIFSLPASAITRSSLVSYASSLQGLKKAALKTAVYNIIKDPSVLAYGSGYNATWWGFYQTDRIPETNECVNRYSSTKYYFSESEPYNSINGMNIEHSFPKSWWGGSKNRAYKDLYNLYPSDASANTDKSNYPMGVVTKVTSGGDGYDKVGTGTIDGVAGRNCWEPGDQYKGDFSRAYMYMATCYQDLVWSGKEGTQELEYGEWPTLKQWAYTLYLQWIEDDRVDELEIARNNAVNGIQGNRNLFVDYPYLAEYIWGDSIDVAFDPYTSITTAEDDARYTGEITIAVRAPEFSPAGGTYTDEQIVSITCATANTSIYYTLDGTKPTSSSTLYTAPITISESTTVKAIAIDNQGNQSNVSTVNYIISSEYDPDPISGEIVFYESFDECAGKGGNDSIFNGQVANATFKPDNEGWTARDNKYYGADQCAKFGTGSVVGVTTTPTFTINGETEFTFKAAAWNQKDDGTSLQLSVSGNASLSETEFTMLQGAWSTFTTTITGSGPISITFTPGKRFFLDEVCAYVPATIFLGDVNRDGSVTIADVTALVDIILGKDATTPYTYDHDAADVNQDDGITIADVTALVDLILGKN